MENLLAANIMPGFSNDRQEDVDVAGMNSTAARMRGGASAHSSHIEEGRYLACEVSVIETLQHCPIALCEPCAGVESKRRLMITSHLLVAEDDGPLGALLHYNLEAEGYQVEVVTRGDEAETRFMENVPDLLVLDWMMPGDEAAMAVRRERDEAWKGHRGKLLAKTADIFEVALARDHDVAATSGPCARTR
ncbi:CheY-like chemotaxis protein [Mesorhizobium sangaii]|uniref:CheY-like chemotaxis protein n=1 Tax=Mesorhizobium sangaii TaxID=505389 RepID=A0A841PTF6_9HYPH|nr:CheY-like chemotaxis protein [Mesorhizobium sangaii]